MESDGRNLFGADLGQPNALPAAWRDTPVTHVRYLFFRNRVRKGYVSNGVGPCQLTDPGLQKIADEKGGCWKPLPNMLVGFGLLDELIRVHGEQGGFAAYNGSGEPAERYGVRAVILRNRWHALLTD